jgi:hypothetical protein
MYWECISSGILYNGKSDYYVNYSSVKFHMTVYADVRIKRKSYFTSSPQNLFLMVINLMPIEPKRKLSYCELLVTRCIINSNNLLLFQDHYNCQFLYSTFHIPRFLGNKLTF